jgi:hypothetical protein
MTAARRAALRKAQVASARKRRRNKKIVKTAGVIAVTVAAGGGSYSRARKRRGSASINVVNTTVNATSNPVNANKVKRVGNEIDVDRWSYNNQVFDENDTMDYGKVGRPKPGYKQSFIPRRKPKGKPNRHVKSKRLNVVYSDGTILSGARQRWTEKQRMTYSPNKRSVRYKDARDRPVPPTWLDPYQQKQKQRAKALREKRAAARAKKRGSK